MGDGSAPRSLSRAGIGRPAGRGCQLPDAILHGKRSHRPRSRAVQSVTAAGFRVRLFSSLGLVVAPPACGPGEDTFVTWASRLHHLARGRPRLLAVRWPRATGLTSYLSGCFCSRASGTRLAGSPAFWKQGGIKPNSECFPSQALTLSRLSASLLGRGLSRLKRSRRADTQ